MQPNLKRNNGRTALRITSPANPLIKTLKALDRKKTRSETGLFLAEGARLAQEAAEAGRWPKILAFSPAALERAAVRRLIEAALDQDVQCVETSEKILTQITHRDNAQNVIGAYEQTWTALDQLPEAPMVIALEAIRDPGNLGTILRTADSVGAGGVVLLDGGCDPFSTECVRASMGSIFSCKVAKTSFQDFEHWRRKKGYALIGAALQGARWHHEALPKRAVLLMGNEQSGLPEPMRKACDHVVRIPMQGKADSLNLAAATAVLAYEFWRQHDYEGRRE